ncbi:AtpZ/AtpI family protein [Neorhodopirellula pilleata]|uniref:F0F1-ATPase subunit n=1 Tax=Neorhodopirellula pilleata TaxID=2714738 RepID=A0A5C6A7I4_9BACT|nr:AtpZ/AtpI family protein [Neorhodopirellula pilleata]TWT95041.1 hypothetical protein Pla100_36200 [Neorhodopirellula pilleata]
MTSPQNDPNPSPPDTDGPNDFKSPRGSKPREEGKKWEGGQDSFQQRRLMMRLASAGFELASFSLILGGLGYAIDQWAGNQTPYIAIVGLLLGFSLGFYRLIILANQLS